MSPGEPLRRNTALSSNDVSAASAQADSVAVVAGGSGGLGAAICESLARHGHRAVAVLYHRQADAAAAVVSRLHALGARAQAWQVDLTAPDGLATTLADIRSQLGRPATGVYAAGPSITVDHLARIPAPEFMRVLNADVIGCLNFIQALLPHLRDGGGALVGITTEQLERIELRGALSSVPKAAVDKLFEVVAKEEARHGIRACTVRAGWVDTGLGADALAHKLPAQAVQALIGSIPLRRFGQAREIGDVVAFLASPLASYVTGVAIPVNGGRHL
jgi:NAD(P)-dependent dehydrogenase (short-subunit alcohol dehydrogenase family)